MQLYLEKKCEIKKKKNLAFFFFFLQDKISTLA